MMDHTYTKSPKRKKKSERFQASTSVSYKYHTSKSKTKKLVTKSRAQLIMGLLPPLDSGSSSSDDDESNMLQHKKNKSMITYDKVSLPTNDIQTTLFDIEQDLTELDKNFSHKDTQLCQNAAKTLFENNSGSNNISFFEMESMQDMNYLQPDESKLDFPEFIHDINPLHLSSSEPELPLTSCSNDIDQNSKNVSTLIRSKTIVTNTDSLLSPVICSTPLKLVCNISQSPDYSTFETLTSCQVISPSISSMSDLSPKIIPKLSRVNLPSNSNIVPSVDQKSASGNSTVSNNQTNIFSTKMSKRSRPMPKRGEPKQRRTTKKVTEKEKRLQYFASFKWKKEDFFYCVTDVETRSENQNSLSQASVRRPVQYFSAFFSNNIWDLMLEETVRYSASIRNNALDLTKADLQNFIGIELVMGVIKMPAYTDYWSNECRYEMIASVMPLRKYQLIRCHIHFVDNNKEVIGNDRYYKISPLLDIVRHNFLSMKEEGKYRMDPVTKADVLTVRMDKLE